MDVEELLRKCQAIALKEEDDDIVTFMGRMKIKRENCCKLLVQESLTHARREHGGAERSYATSLENSQGS